MDKKNGDVAGLPVIVAGTSMMIMELGSKAGVLETAHLQKHFKFYQRDLTSFQEVLPSSHPSLLQILSKDDPLLTKISSR